jgi:hypothetical protein
MMRQYAGFENKNIRLHSAETQQVKTHPANLALEGPSIVQRPDAQLILEQCARLLFSPYPMVGVIDGFRWCILGGQSNLYLPGLVASAIVTGFFLWVGIQQFRKMERSFADII